MKSKKKIIYISLFWIYMILLLMCVIFKVFPHFMEFRGICDAIRENRKCGYLNWNLVPFRTIIDHFSFKNICGNVLSFIPFGFYAFRFFCSDFVKTILASELFILLVQVLRFVALIGYFDIDDFIRYTTGILIGILFAKLYDSKINKTKSPASMEN